MLNEQRCSVEACCVNLRFGNSSYHQRMIINETVFMESDLKDQVIRVFELRCQVLAMS